MASHSQSTRISAPVVIALVLLVVIAAVFVIAVFAFSSQTAVEPLTDEQLETAAAQFAANGDATNGETLINGALGCAACHVIGAQSGIAPPFVGVATVAATRNPELSAAAYLYESIINPAAYLVEGYQNAMPANFATRVTDQDMGDMLAYLLTQTTP